MKRARKVFCGALLASLPIGMAVAAPHIVDIRWDAEGRFAHESSVPAGKFFEVCGALKAGQKVAWSFKGDDAMDFNIHYHLGKDTVYPVKLKAVRDAAQDLQVQAEQVHCWMWTNKGGQPARLSVTLKTTP